MNERLSELRKALNMSMESFGEKLGVSRAAISRLESGQNNFTDHMTKSICREYNVNYDWLVNGEGEMFSDLPATVLDELCKQYGLDDLDRMLIDFYLTLDNDVRQAVKHHIHDKFLKDRR